MGDLDEALKATEHAKVMLGSWQDAAGDLVAHYEELLGERDALCVAVAEYFAACDLLHDAARDSEHGTGPVWQERVQAAQAVAESAETRLRKLAGVEVPGES